ncbi:34267_t:CDS:2, partial [Gigaspora margarita]
RDERIIKENWSSILYNIKGYKEILEIEQRIKNNRENPWHKMVENIIMVDFRSDQEYLIDFKRRVLQNLERFEIDDMKSDHLNEQYYLIVDDPISCPFLGSLSDHIVDWLKNNVNNVKYSLFECNEEESWLKEFIDTFKCIQKNVVGISIENMTETEWYIDVLNPLLKTLVSGLKDESYTESSQQASKGSRSSSNSSNRTSRRSSTSVANNNENTAPSIYEGLTFVNLSSENFNLDDNFSSRSNGIRPDGKFLCKDIVHQFGMEVGVLEVSKSNSSLNKKERDRIKLILAMLMSGAHLRYNFDSQYMTNSIQTLIEEIGFITLQVYNERLIVHGYDFTNSPIKVRKTLIDVLIPIRPTVNVGLAMLWDIKLVINFVKEITKLREFLRRIDTSFGILADQL